MTRMLTGPQRKFCERVVAGDSCTKAYGEAYRTTNAAAAAANGSRLIRTDKVKAEIAAMQARAAEMAGGAVLTLARKRTKLAGIVDAAGGIYEGCKMNVSDKIAAIKLDNDLAGEGSEAAANDGLAAIIARIRGGKLEAITPRVIEME